MPYRKLPTHVYTVNHSCISSNYNMSCSSLQMINYVLEVLLANGSQPNHETGMVNNEEENTILWKIRETYYTFVSLVSKVSPPSQIISLYIKYTSNKTY